jgi:hypothetical protein
MDFVTFAQDGGAGLLGGLAAFGVLIVVLVIVASIFWLWMLIDALVNEPTTNDKMLWFLVIFFLHIIGAIIYFVVRRSGRTRVPG